MEATAAASPAAACWAGRLAEVGRAVTAVARAAVPRAADREAHGAALVGPADRDDAAATEMVVAVALPRAAAVATVVAAAWEAEATARAVEMVAAEEVERAAVATAEAVPVEVVPAAVMVADLAAAETEAQPAAETAAEDLAREAVAMAEVAPGAAGMSSSSGSRWTHPRKGWRSGRSAW